MRTLIAILFLFTVGDSVKVDTVKIDSTHIQIDSIGIKLDSLIHILEQKQKK